ncbi:hypothetical protein IAU59_003415 [Kwoniella sp. CBS 9459]
MYLSAVALHLPPTHKNVPERRQSISGMTEYWISKKQYYCKYCLIYIRDDAPSRKQHETGLKHRGNVDKYTRDLYKTRALADRDKAAEAAEMARIETSAAAAFANDTLSGAPASKPSILESIAASSAAALAARRPPPRDKGKDKFSNYSTAEQLGLVDPEELQEKSSYEIEQEIKGRAGEAGKWETVEAEPTALYTPPPESSAAGEKRTWSNRQVEDERDENDNWKIEYDRKGKKAAHDPYDDDFDPATLLKGIKVKKKEEKILQDPAKVKKDDEGALKREGWTGKLELNAPTAASSSKTAASRDGLEYIDGGWVKKEHENPQKPAESSVTNGDQDIKPDIAKTDGSAPSAANSSENTNDVKPPIDAASIPTEAAGGSSMFKKRRPPPSSRKK